MPGDDVMNREALVSVILPAYNATGYLDRAVQSILQQSYKSFELIIINDGSEDETWKLIETYDDPRVIGVNFEQNQGLINVLNHGLELARGKYIARMDADDIALPERFNKQVEYLEQHPDCGVCGTAVINFNGSGGTCKAIYPCKHKEIIAALSLFERNICHPTAMIRTSVLRENKIKYKEEYHYTEDYMLWLDILRHSRLHNLKEPLLLYHRHDDQVSVRHYSEQMNNVRRIISEQLEGLLLSGERNYPVNTYINFLVQEQNRSERYITEEQSRVVCRDLFNYVQNQESMDSLYARRILLFKAMRASFRYKFSLGCKVKSVVNCLFKEPRLFFASATEFISLIAISRFKSKSR
jgi:glycosyltransferase involved in cell wall biosynthesis